MEKTCKIMVMYVCPFNKSLLNIDIFLSNRLF